MSVTRRLLVLSLAIVMLLSLADSGESRPTDWTFTGYFQVEDPSGNPVANAPVAMDGSTRYNFRLESDPDFGVFWVWDTASCSARELTDSQGKATLRCSIPWEQAEQPNWQSLRISDSRYNVLERKELMRTAKTLSMSFVAAFEGMERPLVQKFAPKLILTARDQGVRPSPVEIMDRNGDGRLGWEDVLVQVYTIAGNPLGEFKLNEIIFWGGDHWYSGVYQYPYLHYVMKYYIIPGYHMEGNTVVPDNPPGIYIMIPHFEWGHIGQTNWFDWYEKTYQQVLQDHAGDSRYTHGTTYAYVFTPPGSSEVVIQYWFFYPFNFSGNRHEGDWEHINVVVDSGNVAQAQIVRVEYYYHHKVTTVYTPGVDFRVTDGTHPVVYVGGFTTDAPCSTLAGYGTHGSYPWPGKIKNINPAGSDEVVGGDGLEIDFDGYRNIELLPKVLPRTVYAENPELTYTLGWQHFAAGWGYPLSQPLPCDHAPFLDTIFQIIDKLPLGGKIFNEAAKIIIFDLFKVGQDLLLEDTNKAPVGPRYNNRWESTSP